MELNDSWDEYVERYAPRASSTKAHDITIAVKCVVETFDGFLDRAV